MGKNYRIAPGRHIKILTPATSANLGPGYDFMGLALSIRDVVRIRTFDSGNANGETLRFTLAGEGAEGLPRNETHLIIASMLRCWGYVEKFSGVTIIPDGLHLAANNAIPHARGLGSSAAAIVAGVMCAIALLPAELEKDYEGKAFQISSIIEGHSDNVAPAITGGLAISWKEQPGLSGVRPEESSGLQGEDYFRKASLEVHPEIVPVVGVPDYKVATTQVRALVPDVVPHRQAAFNSARAALLTHALTTEPQLLYPATEDFLHQRYRAKAMEPSARIVRELRLDGFAAVISGAGPTVLTFAAGEAEAGEAVRAMREYVGDDGLKWNISTLEVGREGVIKEKC